MNKVLYAPILGIMQKRQDFIEDNYKCAEDNNAKIEDLTSQKEGKLVEAKNGAREKYLNSVSKYKDKKSKTVQKAQQEANETIEKSKLELENISNEVKEGLKSKMTDIAGDIVEKVLGYRPEINDFDNKKVEDILYH